MLLLPVAAKLRCGDAFEACIVSLTGGMPPRGGIARPWYAMHRRATYNVHHFLWPQLHVPDKSDLVVQAEFNTLREEVRGRTHAHICTVMLELQSAGNIRLEETSDDSTWQKTCTELLQSRFDAQAAANALGYTKLRVNRVARIHNKPLRLRFDAAVDGDDYNTEYMFWATGADAVDWDTAAIAQQGVPAVSKLCRCADDNLHVFYIFQVMCA